LVPLDLVDRGAGQSGASLNRSQEAASRHAVANLGIHFQRDTDSITGGAPYQIVDACFPGWLSGYPAHVRVAAMVYSNYGVWAFPEPKGLAEMLHGAWKMMLAVLAPSLTDLDAEAATLETGTLCRALTGSRPVPLAHAGSWVERPIRGSPADG
jgi:hypothetical protein